VAASLRVNSDTVDDDGAPDDVALGRFPVRSSAELAFMVDKTLAYAGKSYGGTALFSADAGFSSDSESFASAVPAD